MLDCFSVLLLHFVVDMGHPFPRPLGELEQTIMEAIWRSGSASGREVFSILAKKRDLAYTTVMTVMNRLVDKGILDRKENGKQFVYRARFSKDAYEKRTSERIIRELIRSYGDLAIAQFVDTLDATDPKRLQYLKEKIRTLRA